MKKEEGNDNQRSQTNRKSESLANRIIWMKLEDHKNRNCKGRRKREWELEDWTWEIEKNGNKLYKLDNRCPLTNSCSYNTVKTSGIDFLSAVDIVETNSFINIISK